jgi:hypothetical protein
MLPSADCTFNDERSRVAHHVQGQVRKNRIDQLFGADILTLSGDARLKGGNDAASSR